MNIQLNRLLVCACLHAIRVCSGGSVSFVRIFFFPIRRDRVISCWNSFRQLAISRLMFLRLENSFFPLWNCRDQHRLMHLQTHVWSSNISLFLWKQEKFHHCKNFWQTHRLSWQKLVQKKKSFSPFYGCGRRRHCMCFEFIVLCTSSQSYVTHVPRAPQDVAYDNPRRSCSVASQNEHLGHEYDIKSTNQTSHLRYLAKKKDASAKKINKKYMSYQYRRCFLFCRRTPA